MAEILSVDTCFLIDLEREQRRGIKASATAFLGDHLESEFRLSVVVFGEFAAGFDDPKHPRLEMVRAGYELLETDEETALCYARIHQDLRERKCLIGANDLWIAASSMRHDLPLVTRNAGEFSRVEGLRVIGY
jgi:predicted nucleic acid-binding protein